jgi:uncharacterized protein YjbI with pentapeptide repeats
MRAKLRSWWQTARKHLTVIVFIVLIGVFVLIFLGYWLDWDWTGFNERISSHVQQYQPAKTLWDWLQLLGVLAIPIVIGLGTVWFTTKQVQLTDAVNKDNQRETALQSYIDKMSELLLEKHLLESKPEDEVRKIGRGYTLTVLHRLDSERKRSVLQFLYESGLIVKGNSFINLDGANLTGANLIGANLGTVNLGAVNLSGADLREASLNGAELSGADLREATLSQATLSRATLSRADMSRANLSGADLIVASLNEAELSGANLSGADLIGTDLREAYLREADLSRAELSGANLSGAELSGAHMREADLTEAELSGASLREADLTRVDLTRANLTGADLTGAKVTSQQLNQARSLKGANMPDGTIYLD